MTMRSPFDQAILDEGIFGTPLEAIVRQTRGFESGGNPNAVSNRGARGGMQVMPATFASVADPGWDINDDYHNARAGIRYMKQGWDKSGGDVALTGAYYYGGPGGMDKARQGIAVSDPMNPNYPNTLQYGARLKNAVNGGGMADPQLQGGMPPLGMQDYVRQAQAMIGNTQPSPELIEAMTRNNAQRGANLPLALGAMLSRDQNMQNFGNTMYKDANEARNLIPLGDEGFVDPATGKFVSSPIGEDRKKQKVLELSIRMAQQAEDAAARRAQSQQQFETNTILKQTMANIAQQNSVTQKQNADTTKAAEDRKAEEARLKQTEDDKIRAAIAGDPNSPYKTTEDYYKNNGAERARAEKILQERVEVQGKMKQRQALLDEFQRLNANNPTGDWYDASTSNDPKLHMFNSDKQRMIQLANELQVAGVPQGQGAVSNLERELFANVSPGLQYKKEANDAAHKSALRRMEFHNDHTTFLQDYYQKFGHLNGADQAASQYLRNKYGTPERGPSGGSITNPAIDDILNKYPAKGAK